MYKEHPLMEKNSLFGNFFCHCWAKHAHPTYELWVEVASLYHQPMDRFFDHSQRYFPLPDEAIAFLATHGEVKDYRKGELFMRPDERMPYWCMVLEGLAFGYTLYAAGDRRIHWFARPMDGFAGVRHLYSPAGQGLFIAFLEPTTVYRIAALRMREAKERFAAVSELLHIYKQHHLDRHSLLERVLHQPTAYARYVLFRETFPEIARFVSPQHQADFINVGRSQFFEVRRRWLRGGG